MTDSSRPAATMTPAETAWYALPAEEAANRLGVRPADGLTAAEARQRLQQYGANILTETKAEPTWKRFLKHYRDYMQIVLVVAAGVSLLIGEYGTAIGLFLLTLFNA